MHEPPSPSSTGARVAPGLFLSQGLALSTSLLTPLELRFRLLSVRDRDGSEPRARSPAGCSASAVRSQPPRTRCLTAAAPGAAPACALLSHAPRGRSAEPGGKRLVLRCILHYLSALHCASAGTPPSFSTLTPRPKPACTLRRPGWTSGRQLRALAQAVRHVPSSGSSACSPRSCSGCCAGCSWRLWPWHCSLLCSSSSWRWRAPQRGRLVATLHLPPCPRQHPWLPPSRQLSRSSSLLLAPPAAR